MKYCELGSYLGNDAVVKLPTIKIREATEVEEKEERSDSLGVKT